MPKSARDGSKPWVDPDDAPELDADYFARADVYRGEVLIGRGRGLQKAPTKTRISLRVDPETLAAFQADGKGWQTRMNAVLKASVGKLVIARQGAVAHKAKGVSSVAASADKSFAKKAGKRAVPKPAPARKKA